MAKFKPYLGTVAGASFVKYSLALALAAAFLLLSACTPGSMVSTSDEDLEYTVLPVACERTGSTVNFSYTLSGSASTPPVIQVVLNLAKVGGSESQEPLDIYASKAQIVRPSLEDGELKGSGNIALKVSQARWDEGYNDCTYVANEVN